MDAESRLVIAGTQRYAYDAQNKRIWSCTATGSAPYPCTSQTYFFYGPNGKLLAQLLENRLNAQHPDAPYLADNSMPEFGTLTGADGQTLYYRLFKPLHLIRPSVTPPS